ncbi:MAG: T9SS type A sorting domain-containing protein [Flavobacteriales bacterium]|nr:T9SS type A sorting domain-containing protein [Flavobacteriales bacterium]
MATDPFTDYLVRVYSNFTFGNGGQFSICLTGADENLICDGGTVQTGDGFFTVDICQDAEADIVDFLSTSGSAENFDFILTDDNDLIVAVLVGASLDFNSAPIGAYRVWGVSYNGALQGADPGEPISGVTASGFCLDLSSNYVQVNVEICDGVTEGGLAAWGLFPNPGNGDFTIAYSGKEGLTAMEVFDMNGRLMHSESIAMGNGGRYALSLAGELARGVYAVRLANTGGRANLRLVVQ